VQADHLQTRSHPSPIDLPGITGKEPTVIAITIAAQLLTQRTS
jgi:xanthine/CO dehydrogenase XdhC/CoxF family maturation factor